MANVHVNTEFDDLLSAAYEESLVPYLEAVASTIEGTPNGMAWKDFELVLSRAVLLSYLLGIAQVVDEATNEGASFTFDDKLKATYALSACGAGSEGDKGFQPGNTCAGEEGWYDDEEDDEDPARKLTKALESYNEFWEAYGGSLPLSDEDWSVIQKRSAGGPSLTRDDFQKRHRYAYDYLRQDEYRRDLVHEGFAFPDPAFKDRFDLVSDYTDEGAHDLNRLLYQADIVGDRLSDMEKMKVPKHASEIAATVDIKYATIIALNKRHREIRDTNRAKAMQEIIMGAPNLGRDLTLYSGTKIHHMGEWGSSHSDAVYQAHQTYVNTVNRVHKEKMLLTRHQEDGVEVVKEILFNEELGYLDSIVVDMTNDGIEPFSETWNDVIEQETAILMESINDGFTGNVDDMEMEFANGIKGESIRMAGFLSTSADERMAETFGHNQMRVGPEELNLPEMVEGNIAEQTEAGIERWQTRPEDGYYFESPISKRDDTVIVHIRNAKHGLVVGGLSQLESEKEVILPAGTRLRVTNARAFSKFDGDGGGVFMGQSESDPVSIRTEWRIEVDVVPDDE